MLPLIRQEADFYWSLTLVPGQEAITVCVRARVCVFIVILWLDGQLIYGIDLDKKEQAGSVCMSVCDASVRGYDLICCILKQQRLLGESKQGCFG